MSKSTAAVRMEGPQARSLPPAHRGPSKASAKAALLPGAKTQRRTCMAVVPPRLGPLSVDRPAEAGPQPLSARPSRLAHDARNWLTVLRVHCDLLAQSGAVAESHRTWVEELSAAIDRGQALMGPLLAAFPSFPPAAPASCLSGPPALVDGVAGTPAPLSERNPSTMLNTIPMPENDLSSSVSGFPGMLHLLVVDDETPIRTAVAEIARKRGLSVHTAENTQTARAALTARMADIVLLDLKLPGGGGLALLDEMRTLYPETVVIVMTAYATVASAVEAMRSGASEYLTKPFTMEELGEVLERAAERRHFDLESRRLREKLRTPEGFGTLIGRSPEMERVYRILAKVANSSHPVLVLGESGTGKEMVARTIHFSGPHANRPFVPVDCGSLAPTLIESELFGHAKGAFTGAVRAKDGLLVTAEGGTVFLDEIGELPLDLQAKLLRALQEKEVRPVGSNQRVPIHARILAATNRDLPQMVEQGRFRKDLYFRLNVVNVKLPPLRERRADIPVLAAHFLDRMQQENGRAHTLSDEVLHLLNSYDWPGNVRELENVIERACTLSSGPLLHLGDLPTQLQEHRLQTQRSDQAAVNDGGSDGPGILTISEMEKTAILNTIRQLNGDKLMAAKLLGIGKTTLYRKLKEYGIADTGL